MQGVLFEKDRSSKFLWAVPLRCFKLIIWFRSEDHTKYSELWNYCVFHGVAVQAGSKDTRLSTCNHWSKWNPWVWAQKCLVSAKRKLAMKWSCKRALFIYVRRIKAIHNTLIHLTTSCHPGAKLLAPFWCLSEIQLVIVRAWRLIWAPITRRMKLEGFYKSQRWTNPIQFQSLQKRPKPVALMVQQSQWQLRKSTLGKDDFFKSERLV